MALDQKNFNAVIGDVIRGEYIKRNLTLDVLAADTGIPYGTLRRKIAGGAPLTAVEFIALSRRIGIDPGPVLTEAETIYATMSEAAPTNDLTEKREQKEAEARAMTPDQLAQVEKRAATDDPELGTDEPEAP